MSAAELTARLAQAAALSRSNLSYIAGAEDFAERFVKLPRASRLMVLDSYAQAALKCEARAMAMQRAKWTPELIAQLRLLAPRLRDDAALARAMGLTVTQVRGARRKFAPETMLRPGRNGCRRMATATQDLRQAA